MQELALLCQRCEEFATFMLSKAREAGKDGSHGNMLPDTINGADMRIVFSQLACSLLTMLVGWHLNTSVTQCMQ